MSNHPNFYFDQLKKMKALADGSSDAGLAFVDRESFPVAMNKLEERFVKSLAKQRKYDEQVSAYDSATVSGSNGDNYLFYLHGKIIEDQGLTAVSAWFGEYQYLDILKRFEQEGFVVYSEPRGADTNVDEYARIVVSEIETLIAKGVPASQVTVVGASRGGYIAAQVSHYLANAELNTVLMAACNESLVDFMLEQHIKPSGHLFVVRDVSDVHAGGSCQSLFDASGGVVSAREVVLQTGLSHGFIYRPLDAWMAPVIEWAKR